MAVFSEFGQRLIPPMAHCFQIVLDQAIFLQEFYVDKLQLEHVTIARILQKIAGPAYADLFLAFFQLRENFSQLHLLLCKRLLEVVGKTQVTAAGGSAHRPAAL